MKISIPFKEYIEQWKETNNIVYSRGFIIKKQPFLIGIDTLKRKIILNLKTSETIRVIQ